MNLGQLKAGESCIVSTFGGEGALRQHFLDMGIIPGAEIAIVKFAPMGDPVEVSIHGYELTLRLDDAHKIAVSKLDPRHRAQQHPVRRLSDKLLGIQRDPGQGARRISSLLRRTRMGGFPLQTDAKAFRKELSSIREVANTITRSMYQVLEPAKREQHKRGGDAR